MCAGLNVQVVREYMDHTMIVPVWGGFQYCRQCHKVAVVNDRVATLVVMPGDGQHEAPALEGSPGN
jgi:hypothetical protein